MIELELNLLAQIKMPSSPHVKCKIASLCLRVLEPNLSAHVKEARRANAIVSVGKFGLCHRKTNYSAHAKIGYSNVLLKPMQQREKEKDRWVCHVTVLLSFLCTLHP